jgi:AcrR family transcriptional regulator
VYSNVPSRAAGKPKSIRRVPKQARARERVGRILDAARKELEERSVPDITIEGIAERAGVPVGSVYQYFASKTALLAAVAETVMNETDAAAGHQMAECLALPWREAVDRVVAAAFETLRGAPGYQKLLRTIRFTSEFAAVTAASNERVAGMMALHPGFAAAGISRAKTLEMCRTVVTAANALQDRALSEESPDFDGLIEETQRLVKGYLATYLA